MICQINRLNESTKKPLLKKVFLVVFIFAIKKVM